MFKSHNSRPPSVFLKCFADILSLCVEPGQSPSPFSLPTWARLTLPHRTLSVQLWAPARFHPEIRSRRTWGRQGTCTRQHGRQRARSQLCSKKKKRKAGEWADVQVCKPQRWFERSDPLCDVQLPLFLPFLQAAHSFVDEHCLPVWHIWDSEQRFTPCRILGPLNGYENWRQRNSWTMKTGPVNLWMKGRQAIHTDLPGS